MPPFIHPDFLLPTPWARRLYHDHAESLPIIDYHCHLNPRVLAANQPFENLAQLWVNEDSYKHRVMRLVGVPEDLITGRATDQVKFKQWAATLPQTLGHPLYHWSALELARYFGFNEPLGPDNADRCWHQLNALLPTPEFLPRRLLQRVRAECVCTSDRLLDDLQAHDILAREDSVCRVLPSLRADDIVNLDTQEAAAWLHALAAVTGQVVTCWDSFQHAVRQRLDAFDLRGCRLSDHALDTVIFRPTPPDQVAAVFQKRLNDDALSREEVASLKSGILHFLGGEYRRRGWIMQLHLGALRETSSRLRKLAGPAGGYAGIGHPCDLAGLRLLLDTLETSGSLPRVILYGLNPSDYAALAVLTGSFAEDGVPGKIQFGPAWWYNDHAWGMTHHLDILANYGLLSTFIGMTTDSRSLLSLSRHEYFRRLLCRHLGSLVTRGELPGDEALLGGLVQSIAYNNARQWILNLPVPPGGQTSPEFNRTCL